MNRDNRIKRLINLYLPAFNEQQIDEGDQDMTLTPEQAKRSQHFRYWLSWSPLYDNDRRGELFYLLQGEL
jgi:hypothetical protein